ncbi:uncharacterized protein V1516DRAFT_686862 [Lipomyces oligophaga]|uniref:uncharacterized protein n=1 Tax=Lipomyces oligophaga TaxID=45792 RepID=UPI0034CD9E22
MPAMRITFPSLIPLCGRVDRTEFAERNNFHPRRESRRFTRRGLRQRLRERLRELPFDQSSSLIRPASASLQRNQVEIEEHQSDVDAYTLPLPSELEDSYLSYPTDSNNYYLSVFAEQTTFIAGPRPSTLNTGSRTLQRNHGLSGILHAESHSDPVFISTETSGVLSEENENDDDLLSFTSDSESTLSLPSNFDQHQENRNPSHHQSSALSRDRFRNISSGMSSNRLYSLDEDLQLVAYAGTFRLRTLLSLATNDMEEMPPLRRF